MTLAEPAPLDALREGEDALEVSHLDVAYRVRGKDRLTLRDINFRIGPHESFGLVGESGCGKSTTAQAITRYLPRNGRVTQGSIRVAGRDLMGLGQEELRRLRSRTVSVVYQEPGRALNPSMRIGRQIAEVFEVLGSDRGEALARAEEALRLVQIAGPGRVMQAYPHQLSGGMLQRVVIAMAVAVDPTLLILDEPTTALDATVEAEVLELVSGLREQVD
ncbi:MAG TPA: ABC transporter ATP-binding protein, partial [Acidimicrobiales bacterium]|nr:ABC transporter ATP-binding protein [Acidimicrobiales bacterium]